MSSKIRYSLFFDWFRMFRRTHFWQNVRHQVCTASQNDRRRGTREVRGRWPMVRADIVLCYDMSEFGLFRKQRAMATGREQLHEQ